MQAAENLDPLSAALKSMFSFCLYNARHYEEGLNKLEEALELEPNHYLALQGLGLVCPPLGKFQEAIDGCRRSVKICDAAVLNIASLTLSLAAAGQKSEARKSAAEIEEKRKTSHLPAYFPALIYAVLGDFDKVFVWLETAVEERGYWTQWMRVEPRFDSLRKDPRFAALEKRLSVLTDENEISKRTQATNISKDSAKAGINKKLYFAAISAAAGVLLIIFFGFFSFPLKEEIPPQSHDIIQKPPPKVTNTLLILPFNAEIGNDKILSSGLTDELKSDLGRFKKLSVLSVGKNQISASRRHEGLMGTGCARREP